MAFTATLLNDIEERISKHMQDPQLILIDQDKPSLKFVKQFYKEVSKKKSESSNKEEEGETMQSHELLRLKVDALLDLLTTTPFNQCVVFSNNKRRAQDISETLTSNGWPAQCIHGSQEQTQRLLVFERLRKYKVFFFCFCFLVQIYVLCHRKNYFLQMTNKPAFFEFFFLSSKPQNFFHMLSYCL